jgi:hypothetical protein
MTKFVQKELISNLGIPFFRGKQPLVGQRLLIIEASQSHSDTPHWVGLLWTTDQVEADTSS